MEPISPYHQYETIVVYCNKENNIIYVYNIQQDSIHEYAKKDKMSFMEVIKEWNSYGYNICGIDPQNQYLMSR